MYRHKDILSVAASLSRVSLDNWNCSLSASRLPPFEQLIQGLDEAMETERCRNWSPAGDQLPPFSAPLGLHYLIKSVVRPKILTFIWKMILPNQKNQSLRVWLLNAFKDQIMEALSSHTLILWWLSILAHFRPRSVSITSSSPSYSKNIDSKNIHVHLENDSSEPEKSESESVAAQCFQRPDYGSIEQPHSHTLMIIYSRSLFIFSLCRSFLLAWTWFFWRPRKCSANFLREIQITFLTLPILSVPVCDFANTSRRFHHCLRVV